MRARYITIVFLFSFSALLFADEGEPPKIGNFALEGPQQPGPFLSFGQTLIGRNYVELSYATYSPYHNISPPFNNMNVALTYGITDETSLYLNFPIKADSATRNHAFHGLSSGLSDVTLQLEQSIYAAENTKYQDQATIVGSISLPTQEVTTIKTPQGYGSPSYFLGTTYSRTYVDWLGFVSPALLFTTTSGGVRLGSQFLYQAGIGRNILYVSGKSSLFGLLEVDGQFTQKNQLFGRDRPNSGGNVIALTPSVSLSAQRFVAQVGLGFPVVQKLYGTQTKVSYFLAANVVWTIN